MKRQAFQPGEIRDENDNIIREGAYGKKSAFATADNKGILDYMINNFDALKDAIDGGRVYVASTSDLPATGDVANVYIANDTGKWYYWDPDTSKYVTIDNARTVANEAITARDTAKAWAESSSSPDGANDTDSSTGKTQSAKSWALAAKASEANAKTSETNATNSARTLQADWNVTNTTLQSYIKNKPSTWLTTNLNRPPSMNGVSDYTLQPLLSSVRANRLALLPADQIIIEKTTDGGTTWVDAELPDSQKSQLFKGLTENGTLKLPMIDGKKDTKCGLRVTITGMKYNVPDGTSETEKYNYWNKTYVKKWERYFTIHTLAFWVCDTDDAINVKVQYATGENPNNWYDVFNDPSYGMTGWSDWNIIYIKNQPAFGGGIIQTGNTWNWRLTFFTAIRPGRTSLSTEFATGQQTIGSIIGYGNQCFTSSNNLMSNDHLYTWDLSQNATFPANVTANTFKGSLDGNAFTATKATQDASGNNIVNTYARKDNASITNLTVTGQTSVPTANQGNSSNAIASTEFVAKSISALVNGVPEQLNTLNELATALGNDSNFSATITAELGKKLDESEASDTYVTKTSHSIDIAALKTFITDTVNTGITTTLQKVFPVGSIYTSVTDSRNPNAILGFGTWEALPAGYGLVAQGTATAEDGSTLTFTAGSKSGEFKHQLTVGELAQHIHAYRTMASRSADIDASADVWRNPAYRGTDEQAQSMMGTFQSGNDQYHNNVSACIAAYVWKRTA